MVLQDFPTYQFYAPYATAYLLSQLCVFARIATRTSQLSLPRMATFYDLLLTNSILQKRTVPQTAQCVQKLRDSIICKHGNLINVIKLTKPFTVKRSPEIRNTDLSPLEESHAFAVLKLCHVVET